MKVGQEVLKYNHRSKKFVCTAIVTKVGRKWINCDMYSRYYIPCGKCEHFINTNIQIFESEEHFQNEQKRIQCVVEVIQKLKMLPNMVEALSLENILVVQSNLNELEKNIIDALEKQ